MNFNTSEDLPFQLRGGNDENTAIYNRIAVINRVNYLVQKTLPDFDLRRKSKEFLLCLDMEMWTKFYQSAPKDMKPDEEFCQRMAQVCVEMEKTPPRFDEEVFNEVLNMYKSPAPKVKKTSFFKKIFNKIKQA